MNSIFLTLLLLANTCVFAINGKSIHLRKSPEEEADLFEGDIKGIQISRGAAQIPTISRLKWDPIDGNKGAIVPYEIEASYTQDELNIIRDGLNMVEELTQVNSVPCIQFVPKTNESIYIKIINGSGCWSFVGKQNETGFQELSLKAPGCISKGIVSHEFLHALGFWHEQSRPDRDNYVKVRYENIESGKEHNFNKYSVDEVDYLNQPYDYGSIMHYGATSFSSNGQATIEPLEADVVIGQRKQLSPIDVAELQLFYNCKV